MACTTGCQTKTCESYAACLRNKGARVAYCNSAGGSDLTTQKRWDNEIANYRAARADGLQPASTRQADIDTARRISDATGTAYRADV